LEKGIEFIHDDVESFEVGEDKLVRMMLERRVRATFTFWPVNKLIEARLL
jgi:hypothetical protein